MQQALRVRTAAVPSRGNHACRSVRVLRCTAQGGDAARQATSATNKPTTQTPSTAPASSGGADIFSRSQPSSPPPASAPDAASVRSTTQQGGQQSASSAGQSSYNSGGYQDRSGGGYQDRSGGGYQDRSGYSQRQGYVPRGRGRGRGSYNNTSNRQYQDSPGYTGQQGGQYNQRQYGQNGGYGQNQGQYGQQAQQYGQGQYRQSGGYGRTQYGQQGQPGGQTGGSQGGLPGRDASAPGASGENLAEAAGYPAPGYQTNYNTEAGQLYSRDSYTGGRGRGQGNRSYNSRGGGSSTGYNSNFGSTGGYQNRTGGGYNNNRGGYNNTGNRQSWGNNADSSAGRGNNYSRNSRGGGYNSTRGGRGNSNRRNDNFAMDDRDFSYDLSFDDDDLFDVGLDSMTPLAGGNKAVQPQAGSRTQQQRGALLDIDDDFDMPATRSNERSPGGTSSAIPGASSSRGGKGGLNDLDYDYMYDYDDLYDLEKDMLDDFNFGDWDADDLDFDKLGSDKAMAGGEMFDEDVLKEWNEALGSEQTDDSMLDFDKPPPTPESSSKTAKATLKGTKSKLSPADEDDLRELEKAADQFEEFTNLLEAGINEQSRKPGSLGQNTTAPAVTKIMTQAVEDFMKQAASTDPTDNMHAQGTRSPATTSGMQEVADGFSQLRTESARQPAASFSATPAADDTKSEGIQAGRTASGSAASPSEPSSSEPPAAPAVAPKRTRKKQTTVSAVDGEAEPTAAPAKKTRAKRSTKKAAGATDAAVQAGVEVVGTTGDVDVGVAAVNADEVGESTTVANVPSEVAGSLGGQGEEVKQTKTRGRSRAKAAGGGDGGESSGEEQEVVGVRKTRGRSRAKTAAAGAGAAESAEAGLEESASAKKTTRRSRKVATGAGGDESGSDGEADAPSSPAPAKKRAPRKAKADSAAADSNGAEASAGAAVESESAPKKTRRKAVRKTADVVV